MMKAALFTFAVITTAAVAFSDVQQNSSHISLPLKDRMDAALTATIDTSDFNNIIKEYINKMVVAEVKAALDNTKADINASLEEHKEKMTTHITETSNDIISRELSGLQASSENNKQTLQRHGAVIAKAETELQRHGTVIAKVETEMKKEETRCAFLAGLKNVKHNLPDGTSDIFDKVKFNKGGCYDGSSGKFTANENGLYVFSWTTMSNDKKDFTSKIVKNGNDVAGNVVDNDVVSDAMTGSQTVVIEMNRGDKVWVEVVGSQGKHIQNSWSNTLASVFCGFKI